MKRPHPHLHRARAPRPAAVPPRTLLRRLRRRRLAWWLAAIVVLALAAAADHRGLLLHEQGDVQRYHGRSFRVTRIVDGDTLDIDAPDGAATRTRVRLWGIDTPEVAQPRFGRHEDQPGAHATTVAAGAMALDEVVTLEIEGYRSRDDFGRLLAYVRLTDGRYLNEELLALGLARADNRPGDKRFVHRRMQRYEIIEHQARLKGLGLWAQASSSTRAWSGDD